MLLSKNLIAVVIGSRFFFGLSICLGQAREQVATIDAFETVYEQWLEDVEFVCHYTLSIGRAATIEHGLSRNWQVELHDERVSGVFNKGLGKVRCSSEWVGEPQVVGRTEESFEVSNLDCDEVANSDVRLRYTPVLDPRKPTGVAVFVLRNMPGIAGDRRIILGPAEAGWSSYSKLSPLNLARGAERTHFSIPAGATDFARRVVEETREKVAVELSFKKGEYRTRAVVTFVMGYSCPVVQNVVRIHVGNARRSDSVCQAFDFVECPGGPVARTIRYVFTNPDPEHKDLPFSAMEWRSDDLGNRRPTPDDFLVPFRKGTLILSVKDVSSVITDGKLDVDRVDVRELMELMPKDNSVEVFESVSQREKRSTTRWLLVLTGVAVVAVLAAYFFVRLRTESE